MESSVKASKREGSLKLKPALGPKPRLAPKPFSLQTNSAVRSIHAPKPAYSTAKSETDSADKSVASDGPKSPVTTPVQKPPQITSVSATKPSPAGVPTKPQPTPTKASETLPHQEDCTDSGPALKTTPPKKTPESEPVQNNNVIQTNHKTSTDTVTDSKQEDKIKMEDETQVSVTKRPKGSSSDSPTATSPSYHWGGTRKRLSMELTSKFELGGPPPSPQPVTTPKTIRKAVLDKPVSPVAEQSQSAPEPSNRESDSGDQEEDYSGGNSIKLRISRLFDSVSKQEVTAKKEELEIPNGIGGVKEQIRNWVAETGSESPKVEKKPQVTSRIRSKR